MYLSVQGAAQRLGVSPHTVRRWTDSGFLPCSRTSGGHRRIRPEDVDDLARLLGGRNHLAARLASERQLDDLVAAALLAGDPGQADAPGRLARHLASLFGARRCVISELCPDGDALRVVAVWDQAGGDARRPASAQVARRPLVAHVLAGGVPAVVDAGDPRADPAEAAVLRRYGDRYLVLVPVRDRGRSAGLVELLHDRHRRDLGASELRLARAAAAQVAAALRGDAADERLRRRDAQLRRLTDAVATVTLGQPALTGERDEAEVLRSAAALATRALGGVACVAARDAVSAGASDPDAAGQHAAGGTEAHVLVASAPSSAGCVTLTLTLGRRHGDGELEILALIAALAAGAMDRLAPV